MGISANNEFKISNNLKLRASICSLERTHPSDQAGPPIRQDEDTFVPTANTVGGSLHRQSVSPKWRTLQLAF
jgi:hypothetical protein